MSPTRLAVLSYLGGVIVAAVPGAVYYWRKVRR